MKTAEQQRLLFGELLQTLIEVSFALNSCQLVIVDTEARKMIRDLVSKANRVITEAEDE